MSSTVYDKYLTPSDRECIVTKIVVTASGTVSTSSEMPDVFHWRHYLVVTPGPAQSGSVVIDMQPANPPIGFMVISSKTDVGTTAKNKVELDISVQGSPTVSQIINVFLEHGMQRYKFDDNGLGCRYWTFTGLRFLEEHGLVEPGAAAKAERFHNELAQRYPDKFPMPIRKGVFY